MAVWFFYGLPAAGGPKFDPVPTGILVITLLYSGYLSEVFRAGLAAVPRGQVEAAQAIGLGRTTTFWSVTLPQTVRIVLPAMGNVFADIVKDTAILSVIGLNDLIRESLRWAQFYRPFRYFEFVTTAGIVYLVLVVAATQAGRLLERRTGAADVPVDRDRAIGAGGGSPASGRRDREPARGQGGVGDGRRPGHRRGDRRAAGRRGRRRRRRRRAGRRRRAVAAPAGRARRRHDARRRPHVARADPRHGRRGRRLAGPPRRPREQRRRRPSRLDPRRHARRLGRAARREPPGPVLRHPGGRPAHGRGAAAARS